MRVCALSRLVAVAALALALTLALPASALPQERASLPDIEDEVMCPVCGTVLEHAFAPQAERERALIRRLIAEGRTKEEIKEALVAEYGEDVLAVPADEGFDLLAWVVPIAGLLLALALIAFALVRVRRRGGRDAGPVPADLEPGDAARLDEELPAREQAALPASEAGSANGGGEELASLVAERQIQRALQARHDATALRGSAIDGGHAWAALMARISHEIRTPLNAVIGFSDLMQAELFGPLGHSRYAEYVDHIRDSGKALLKSAEDTLAMTSLLAADPSPLTAVPLWDIVEDAWSFLAAEAAAKRVTLELPPEVRVDLLAERRALRQIVLNHLSEAVTRAEAGCTITLGVSTDGCLALVDIVVPRATTIASCGDQTLGLSIARALLELKGSELVEWRHGDRGWRVATVLELAVQADFFASAS